MRRQFKNPTLYGQSGQATVEYILLISVVLGIFLKITSGLAGTQWISKFFTGPISQDFSPSYRYGYPGALGPDDSNGPLHHPRAIGTGNAPPGASGSSVPNFRIFYVIPGT